MNRNLNTNITQVKFKNNHVIYENFIKCTIKDYEYNLSYNPTLLSGSQGVLTPYSSSVSSSVVYVTPSDNYGILKDFTTGSDFSPYVSCIGLYNDAGDLLAVAKMAAPMPLSANTYTTFLIKYDTQWENKPYFTPSNTPSTTPSVTPSITATPSITPSITPSPVNCILSGIAVVIPPSPSVTPSITTTPSVTPSFGISVTPTPTQTPPSSEIPVNWRVSGITGGQLILEDSFSLEYLNKLTNGTTHSGIVTIPNSGNYTIINKYLSGAGNIINCRICWTTVFEGGELDYTTSNQVNTINTTTFTLPMTMNGYLVNNITIDLRSGNGTPFVCVEKNL